MSVNEEIRAFLGHGIGTRKVKVNRDQVFTIGTPSGHGENKWRFYGMTNDILRQIDTARRMQVAA